MTNALYHAGTSTTVQFPANPIRGQATTIKRFQSQGFDSDGTPYVYGKTIGYRQSHPLTYTNVPQAVLDALLTFMQSRNGDKHSFTWYDHDSASHTARFDGDIRYTETRPGKFKIALSLFEDL